MPSPSRWVAYVFPACAALATCFVPASVAPADDKPKLPQSPRFPFGEEPAKTFRDGYAKAAGMPKEVTNTRKFGFNERAISMAFPMS